MPKKEACSLKLNDCDMFVTGVPIKSLRLVWVIVDTTAAPALYIVGQ